MRSTVFAAAASSVAALVGFAGAANASATIDLIWADTGTDTISNVMAMAVPDHGQVDWVGVVFNPIVDPVDRSFTRVKEPFSDSFGITVLHAGDIDGNPISSPVVSTFGVL